MSDPRILAVAALLLVLLAVVARLLYVASHPGPRPPLRTAAAGVAAVGAVWVLANTEIEGDTLVTLTRRHGLTESDLPAIVLFVVAAAMVVRSFVPVSRPRRPSRRRAS